MQMKYEAIARTLISLGFALDKQHLLCHWNKVISPGRGMFPK